MKQNGIYHYPIALTIAGSDCSGGAGIQADLKTFSALGVFGTSAITAVTAQNTQGVRAIQAIDPSVLRNQIEAVLEDLQVNAIKIGMLHNKHSIQVVADLLATCPNLPVILDPVMISTSGSKLLEEDAIKSMIELLFSKTCLLTPNIPETEFLTGIVIQEEEDILHAAKRLRELGVSAAFIKGGHRIGKEATDWLFLQEDAPERFSSPSIDTQNTHGTGCTLSSAITAYMALGFPLKEAIRKAKMYITQALRQGADVEIGQGHGPVNHFYSPVPLHKIKSSHE